ncbi:MAG: hypothetical protein ACXVBR_14625 [Flavisolibacter sp.]
MSRQKIRKNATGKPLGKPAEGGQDRQGEQSDAGTRLDPAQEHDFNRTSQKVSGDGGSPWQGKEGNHSRQRSNASERQNREGRGRNRNEKIY